MSTTVCIMSLDEGQGFKVWVEAPEAQEAAGMPAMPGMEPGAAPAEPTEEQESAGGQTVKTMKEALTLAMEALKTGGQMSDMNGQEQAFKDGFGTGKV
jgi:hypothetical protein